MVLQARPVERAAEGGERVHHAQLGVDRLRVVVLPARLLLLAAPVVVHGERGDPGLTGGAGEQDRGAAAVGADLQKREAQPSRFDRGRVQGQPLADGHEALRRLERGQDLGPRRRGFGVGVAVGVGIGSGVLSVVCPGSMARGAWRGRMG